jgi:transketolase
LSDGNGPTHQAIEDISIMRGIPGMEVYCPADEDDLVKMLPHIWQTPNPAYVRINHKKGNYDHAPFEPGKAEVISEGRHITFLVHGFLLGNVLEAKEILKDEGDAAGLSVGVINMRTLKPVDEEIIINSVKNSEALVIVEDHFATGGLYSIVAETLLKHRITAPVLQIALNKWFKPGLLNEVLEFEGFTPAKIAHKVNAFYRSGTIAETFGLNK